MSEQQSHSDPVGAATLMVIAKADKFNRWMYETIKPFLKGEILEVGSGIGNISKFLIPGELPITLSDYSPVYRDQLQKQYGHFKNVVTIIDLDLQHPEFEQRYFQFKGKFDTIFMLNVIEHLANDVRAAEHCKFMLRIDGHLIILAPAYQFLFCRLDRELGHYRRYTLKKLSKIVLKAGLTIFKKQYFNSLGIAGWLVSGKIFRARNLGTNEMASFNRLVPLAKLCDKIFFKKAGLSAIIVAQKK